jgi:spore photoproduct lyase
MSAHSDRLRGSPHRVNASRTLALSGMADQPVLGDRSARPWRPKHVLVTPSALERAHGRAMVERMEALGIPVDRLPSDRLPLERDASARGYYGEAKSTMAVVVAPPSKLRLQPIAPSADWRVDLAEGCPAHCSYCYLAGSLKGPPITRVYANLDEIVDVLPNHLGLGVVTSRNAARVGEGTTFEASCYTDPLAIEHLTGSLSSLISWFGQWEADVQLRFTTKFTAVEPLLGLDHRGRTRMRGSLNPAEFARFEGGTSPVRERLRALRRMADAGYPIGLTIAPIIAAEGWQDAYDGLISDVAVMLGEVARSADLTVELITHRFSPGSKAVLESWYPGSQLDMSEAGRREKRTRFGAVKQVYDATTMTSLRRFFEERLTKKLPGSRILYWT